MEHWGTCNGRVGSGCGGEGCKAKPFSGAPEGSADSRSRSQSAEMPLRPTADVPDIERQVNTHGNALYGMQCVHDSPGGGSLELQLLVASQSQQTGSGTSEEPVSQMKWKTSVYPVGTCSTKNKNLEVMKMSLQTNCCAHWQCDAVLTVKVRPRTEEALHRLALDGPLGASAGDARE